MNCMSKILKPFGASVTESKETGKALSTEFYTTTMEMTKILVLNTVLVLQRTCFRVSAMTADLRSLPATENVTVPSLYIAFEREFISSSL